MGAPGASLLGTWDQQRTDAPATPRATGATVVSPALPRADRGPAQSGSPAKRRKHSLPNAVPTTANKVYDKLEGKVMAAPALDWSQCPAVESVPGKRSGAWVFRGTRTPVSVVFENLQDMNVDQLVDEFGVTREQVQAVLEFAAQSTEVPVLRP